MYLSTILELTPQALCIMYRGRRGHGFPVDEKILKLSCNWEAYFSIQKSIIKQNKHILDDGTKNMAHSCTTPVTKRFTETQDTTRHLLLSTAHSHFDVFERVYSSTEESHNVGS